MELLLWLYFICFLGLTLVLLPGIIQFMRFGNQSDPFDEREED